MSNPFSLEGKVALVTGANTGLGQGIALALAEAGADIAAAGIQAPTETEAKVKALGRRFIAIEANLISIEPVQRIIEETIAGLGGLDILVNNAGLIRRTDAVDFSEQDWDDVLNVNLKSAFFMAQAAGRHFIAQGAARSSTSPRCCRSRAVSACRPTLPASPASPASPACLPTNGPARA